VDEVTYSQQSNSHIINYFGYQISSYPFYNELILSILAQNQFGGGSYGAAKN
jgi:hypothetical protein